MPYKVIKMYVIPEEIEKYYWKDKGKIYESLIGIEKLETKKYETIDDISKELDDFTNNVLQKDKRGTKLSIVRDLDFYIDVAKKKEEIVDEHDLVKELPAQINIKKLYIKLGSSTFKLGAAHQLIDYPIFLGKVIPLKGFCEYLSSL